MSDLIVNNYVIDAPIVEILTKLRSELTNGKLSTIEQKGDYVRVTCPIHSEGHEKHPSCSVYCGDGDLRYGTYHCFTCGNSGPLYEFIALCFDESTAFGKKWLIENFGTLFTVNRILKLEDIDLSKKEESEEFLDESALDEFSSYHPYMTQRKLTDEVIKEFEIKYNPLRKSIVFPVRDINGKLIALPERSIEKKKFYLPKNFNKGNIYALNKIDFTKPVYLTESQINCLTIYGYGSQALALFGAGVTDEQIKVLNDLPVRNYIIAFDPDPAGIKGTRKLCKALSKTKFVDVVLYNDNRDINDLSEEEFKSLEIVDRNYLQNTIYGI